MTTQNRFYFLIAALVFSNPAMALDYHGVCASDASRNCYICAETDEEKILADCSNFNDGDTWCKKYTTKSINDEVYIGNQYYKCTSGHLWTPVSGQTCGSDNCISSSWSAHRTGYEVQTYRYCSSSTCVSETRYRCAKNYYGTSTNGTSGCSKCSSSDDNIATKSGSKWVSTGEKSQGFTNAAGNTTAVNTCYIPRLGGSEMYLDSTGAYEFNSNCYWS